MLNAISLFSSGGIGDLALREIGINILVANELNNQRAEVFSYNYPNTKMIQGDIWSKKEEILEQTIKQLNHHQLDLILATPPCQGMSKNGRGKLLNEIRNGRRLKEDQRNRLVIPVIEIMKELQAETLVMENVPEMEHTLIFVEKYGLIKILDFIQEELGNKYQGFWQVVEFANYGIPQRRKRLITIFTKNQNFKNYYYNHGTLLPKYTHSFNNHNSCQKWVTVKDIISQLPPLDGSCKTKAICEDLPFHYVPILDEDKYFWVSHTPAEKSAFDNQCINPNCLYDQNLIHGASKDQSGINRANQNTPIRCEKCGELLPRPWVKENNQYRIMKGYTSAYKRMSWHLPANTLTKNLSYACSDQKLHPDQNRVLSLYEAMLLHTITDFEFFWQRKDGKKVSDKLIREIIGESIPPRGLYIIFKHLIDLIQSENLSNHKVIEFRQKLTKAYQQLSIF